jgi:hypothetical protein
VIHATPPVAFYSTVSYSELEWCLGLSSVQKWPRSESPASRGESRGVAGSRGESHSLPPLPFKNILRPLQRPPPHHSFTQSLNYITFSSSKCMLEPCWVCNTNIHVHSRRTTIARGASEAQNGRCPSLVNHGGI